MFGARGSGKSTFLRDFFKDTQTLWIDLLNAEEEDRLIRAPQSLKEQIALHPTPIDWIIIDEVQKAPRLLDVVHHLIETKPYKFALTGSSARKLKRGHANLLAGRAFVNTLFPLTHLEMGNTFSLDHALAWGSLPKMTQLTQDEEKAAFLRSYALTYLREEIQLEQAVRRLDPFRKFLDIAAQTNGEIINYTNVARDVGVDVKTVQSYFHILEDTLIGFFLEPYHTSIRKAQRMSPKFYFFDTGVKRALDRTLTQPLHPNTYGYGKAFEHFILLEIMRLSTYRENDYKLSYLRTQSDLEIDLILERPGLPTALIEIKSSDRVDDRDTRVIEHFLDHFKNSVGYCLSRDPIAKKIGHVHALPWQRGIQDLGL